MTSKWILFFNVILDGQFEDYCIADEQTPDEELQKAINWACGNGADCSKIQKNGPCYLPNNMKDHASFAFNSYYQRMKHKGGSCYFNAAAIITALDPSKRNNYSVCLKLNSCIFPTFIV